MTSCDKFSDSPTLEALIGKFQHFNAIDGSIEMMKTGWISKTLNLYEKAFYILQGPNSEPP